MKFKISHLHTLNRRLKRLLTVTRNI